MSSPTTALFPKAPETGDGAPSGGASGPRVVIDVYFDFICPWCYIGRNRMARALEARPNVDVAIRWQPYQLNPGMPQDGIDRRSYLIARFGAMERVAHVLRLIRLAADGDGVPMALERAARMPNSLNAHRLAGYLAGRGHAPETVIDRIFAAFMVEGLDIGDTAVLSELAGDLGDDVGAAADYLRGPSDVAAIQARDLAARRDGVQAVPCFVFNRRYGLSGAQEPTAFFPFLDHPEIYDLAEVSDPGTG